MVAKRSKRGIVPQVLQRNGSLFAADDIVIVEDPRDSWSSPELLWRPTLVAMGRTEFDLDPCTNDHSSVPALVRWMRRDSVDGEPIPGWPAGSLVWMNPPYSAPAAWVSLLLWHCTKRAKVERCEAVALLPCDPSVRWWRDVWRADRLCWVDRRPRFEPAPGIKASSSMGAVVLAYYGTRGARWARAHRHLGPVTPGPVRLPAPGRPLPEPPPSGPVLPLGEA